MSRLFIVNAIIHFVYCAACEAANAIIHFVYCAACEAANAK